MSQDGNPEWRANACSAAWIRQGLRTNPQPRLPISQRPKLFRTRTRRPRLAQGFERVESLLLVGGEERTDFGVELFDDHIRRLACLFMDGIELRLHLGNQRLDLSLLGISQAEHMSEHRGKVGRTVPVRRHRLVRRLRARKLSCREEARGAACKECEFV